MFEEDARRSTVSKGPHIGGSAVHSEWKAMEVTQSGLHVESRLEDKHRRLL